MICRPLEPCNTRCNEDETFIEAATLILSVEAYKQERKARWHAVKEEIV
jgi:hypothetical protein